MGLLAMWTQMNTPPTQEQAMQTHSSKWSSALTQARKQAAKTSSHIIHSNIFPMIFLENTDQKLHISACLVF